MKPFLAALLLALAAIPALATQTVHGRPSLVLTNEDARLVIDLHGGAIASLQLHRRPLNPLQWATPAPGDTAIAPFGHFLCLDRWGQPSEAEERNGMPFHGEASRVAWQVLHDTEDVAATIQAAMAAKLPMAGLSVQRRIILPKGHGSIAVIREDVRNDNKLGRIFNMVQHPTIGGPFLDASTIVDCNGRQGFAQGGPMPHPEEPSSFWPRAFNQDGESVDLRHLAGNHSPNVTSFVIDDALGWVTAASPTSGLLIGYLWKTSDYPWVNLWRNARDGKPDARGLEFGTTGLHQPFPVLTRKKTIFGRPLYQHLDAGETISKAYLVFILEIPRDFGGVQDLGLGQDRITIRERAAASPRSISVDLPRSLRDTWSP